jgi:hypothetical protein
MTHTVNATFDGVSFQLDEPLALPANTKVRLTVEPVIPTAAASPILGQPYSALEILKKAKLNGPADWSENINRYLNEGLPENGS